MKSSARQSLGGGIRRWCCGQLLVVLLSGIATWPSPATSPLGVPSNPDPARLVWIPPGTFTMGSPDSEQDRSSDEGPQTVVTLTHGFFMGHTEVTQGEYEAVVRSNPSYFHGDPNLPVEQVTWDEAIGYCTKLTEQERQAGRLPAGWYYRLPTEAEWEYACRAGTTTRFSYGDDPGYWQLGNYAWYASNSGATTHAVGLKQPNPWGLHDMACNVWEWCLDWYGTYPGGSVTDPLGATSGSYRVIRGGSWHSDGRYCRSARRNGDTPDHRDYCIGFRAVLAPSVLWLTLNGMIPSTNHVVLGNDAPVTVALKTSFANGTIFYTLDGSDPLGEGAREYAGPLTITNSAIISAVAYDFDQAAYSLPMDPVTIEIIPVYQIAASTEGGGSVAVNPPAGPILSNTVVTVTATPADGWTFMAWTGDVASTEAALTFPLTQNLELKAVFGTGVGNTISGNGSVSTYPAGPLYSYGSSVWMMAQPQAGNYFRYWSGPVSSNIVSPLKYSVTNANPVFNAYFGQLPVQRYALNLLVGGPGDATKSPYLAYYTNGATVTLTATPALGYEFLGWSGDAMGAQNPLAVTMDRTKTITASFGTNKPPTVRLISPADGASFPAPADIPIQAEAADSDGQVVRVELYVGNSLQAAPANAPYSFVYHAEAPGDYVIRAVAVDDLGAATTSALVTVKVNPAPPTITEQPRSQVVGVGREAGFTVSASGTPPLSYRWRCNGANVAGATNATLTIPSVELGQAGQYSVVVSNSAGAASSEEATLTVVPLTEVRPEFWVPDGPVYTLLATNGLVYLGGSFSNVWALTGAGAAVDASSGVPDGSFPRADGEVYAVLPDGAGGWYLGGNFRSVGGLSRERLAHVVPETAGAGGYLVDTNWAPRASAPVRALARLGNRICLGGSFRAINDTARNRLATVRATDGQLLDWNPDADGVVHALAVGGAKLFVGGEFASFGATTGNATNRNRLAAFDTETGALLDWNPNGEKIVFALGVAGDTVFVGGTFNLIGNSPAVGRTNLAAVSADTGQVSQLPVVVDGTVSAIAVAPDWLYIGGDFTTVNGQPAKRVAALDLTAAIDPLKPWPDAGTDSAVHALALAGNTLYLGGHFTQVGSQLRSRLAAVDVQTGELLAWHPEADGDVRALAVANETVLAGGWFTRVGRTQRLNVAALDIANGAVTAWNPGADGQVRALAVAGNTVYVGGRFNQVGGLARANLAAVSAQDGHVTDWNPQADDTVYALGAGTNAVYAGGSFVNVGGQRRPRLAALSASTGLALAWSIPPNDTVFALTTAGNVLYAGGDFTSLGSTPAGQLAAISLLTGNLRDWNPDLGGGRAFALAKGGSVVYAGGIFAQAGGEPHTNLVAVAAATGEALPWPLDAVKAGSASVDAIAVSEDRVFVAGWFDGISGEARTNLAAFSWPTQVLLGPQLAPDFKPDPDGEVWALAAYGHTLFAGGQFEQIGAQPRPYFAVLGPSGPPIITLQPAGQRVGAGANVTFTVSALGQDPLQYQWLFEGNPLAGATDATLTLNRVSQPQAGRYQVIVANPRGQAASQPATLEILTSPPTVVGTNTNRVVGVNAELTLAANASGVGPLRYQWRLNGVDIPGATNETLRLANLQPDSSGSYSVVVANPFGAVSGPVQSVVVLDGDYLLVDNFADRVRGQSVSGTVYGNSTTATLEPGEPIHLGKRCKKSLWFAWVAPANGPVTFSSRGSGFDTILAVYTNNVLSALQPVAGDEDSGGYLTSKVTFNAVEGVEYQIAVDDFNGKGGEVVLRWNLEPLGVEVPQILQGPFSQTVSLGESVALTVRLSSGRFTYQWFLNDQEIPGATNSFLVINGVQPEDAGAYTVGVTNQVWRGVTSAPASIQINQTDTGPADERVTSTDKLGDVVQLVGGNGGQGGGAGLHGRAALHSGSPFGAAPARGFSGLQLFSTATACKQPDEPNHCGVAGGASQWYVIQPQANGKMRVSTEGSDFDTVLAVYTGPENALGFDELTSVNCDNDSGADGKTSRLEFDAVTNLIYQIAVDGVDGARGTVCLTYGLEPIITEQPANQTVAAGGTATFRVTATGTNWFQWFCSGEPLLGETNAVLSLTGVTANQAGTYCVIVSNHAWSKTSQAATLDVSAGLRLTSPKLLSDGRFQFELTGLAGPGTVVQASTNLVNWLPVFTNSGPGPSFIFIDPRAPNYLHRFYRGRP